MSNWVTKKSIAIVLIAFASLSVALHFLASSGYCYAQNLPCAEVFWATRMLATSVLVLPLLFFIRPGVLLGWVKFLLISNIFFWFLMWLFRGGGFLSPGPDGVAQISSIFIVLGSLFFFYLKSLELRRIEQGKTFNIWLKWSVLISGLVVSLVLSVSLLPFVF